MTAPPSSCAAYNPVADDLDASLSSNTELIDQSDEAKKRGLAKRRLHRLLEELVFGEEEVITFHTAMIGSQIAGSVFVDGNCQDELPVPSLVVPQMYPGDTPFKGLTDVLGLRTPGTGDINYSCRLKDRFAVASDGSADQIAFSQPLFLLHVSQSTDSVSIHDFRKTTSALGLERISSGYFTEHRGCELFVSEIPNGQKIRRSAVFVERAGGSQFTDLSSALLNRDMAECYYRSVFYAAGLRGAPILDRKYWMRDKPVTIRNDPSRVEYLRHDVRTALTMYSLMARYGVLKGKTLERDEFGALVRSLPERSVEIATAAPPRIFERVFEDWDELGAFAYPDFVGRES